MLQLDVQINGVGALTGLRLLRHVTITPKVDMKPDNALGSLTLWLAMAPFVGPLLGLILMLVQSLENQLKQILKTLLDDVANLTSPPAIPPALTETFGELAPTDLG